MGKLHIDLLGTSFSIQASDEDAYLEKLLSYYSRIVDSVSQIDTVKTPLQISILSGIMLCDELYKEKKSVISAQNGEYIPDNSQDDEEISRRTLSMIEKINKVL